jgi:hypothetical protein
MNLKKIGKVFTSKFVGTGPSFYKKNLPGRSLTMVEKHCSRMCVSLCEWFQEYQRHVLPFASKVKQKNFWDCWPPEVENTVFV